MVAKKFRKENHLPKRLIYSLLIGLSFIAIVSFLIISNLRISQKRSALNVRIDSLKKEIQALEGKNNQLKAGIFEVQSESYQEEKIREQGYKKPGEEVVVVVPPEQKQKEEIPPKSFWQKILEKLHLK